MGEVEAIQEKIARLTRERDEMATQASACAEEVDRVRLEIGAVQAEVERLKGELAAVNNEFGSATPDWPEAWKRVADLKQLAGDRWRENVDLKEQIHVLTAALAESERKRVEAVEALKPFALAAEHYEPDEGDGDHSLWADDGLRVRHLRAAYSALITQEVEHGR